MASVTQELRVQETPATANIGLSRGVSPVAPDKTLGTLFAGIGETLTGAVNATDEHIQRDISNRLTTGIDEIRAEQGVDLAANMAAGGASLFPEKNTTNGAMPAAVGNTASEIERLNKARSEGKVSDSYFYGRATALVKQVRALYPGYREEIDTRVSKILGTNPANALRNSMENDFNALSTQRQSVANQREATIRQNLEHVNPALYNRWNKGERGDQLYSEMEMSIRDSQAFKADQERQMKSLDLRLKTNQVSEMEAEKVATDIASGHVSKIIGDGSDAIGFSGVRDQVLKMAGSGKQPTPDEMNELMAKVGTMEAATASSLEALFNRKLEAGSDRTLRSVLGVEKTQKIIDNSMNQIRIIKGLISSGNFDMASRAANIAKYTTDAGFAELLRTSPAARALDLVSKLPQEAQRVMFQGQAGPEGPAAITKALQAIMASVDLKTATVGSGSESAESAVRGVAAANAKSGGAGQASNALLKRIENMLSNKSLPPEVTANVARKTFEDGSRLLEQFNPSQRKTVFSRLTTPETTARIAALGNPAVSTDYRRWAERGWGSVIKSEAATLADGIVYGEGFNIIFDPNSNQFGIVDQSSITQPNQAMDMAGISREDQARQNRAAALPKGMVEAVKGVNQALFSLGKIYESQGLNPTQEIQRIISSYDMDPNQPKQLGLWQALRNAAQAVITDQASAGKGASETEFEWFRRFNEEPAQGVVNSAVKSFNETELRNELAKKVPIAVYTQGERDGVISDGTIDLNSEAKAGRATNVNLRQDVPVTPGIRGGLELIGGAEASAGYNQIVGKNRSAPLDQMTLTEVYAFQKNMLASGSASTAVGRYQFVNDTLMETVQMMGIDPDNTKFTPEVQDALALGLMRRAGLDQWREGKLTDEQFGNRLAGRWAAIIRHNGTGAYDGYNGNRATLPIQRVLDIMRQQQPEGGTAEAAPNLTRKPSMMAGFSIPQLEQIANNEQVDANQRLAAQQELEARKTGFRVTPGQFGPNITPTTPPAPAGLGNKNPDAGIKMREVGSKPLPFSDG